MGRWASKTFQGREGGRERGLEHSPPVFPGVEGDNGMIPGSCPSCGGGHSTSSIRAPPPPEPDGSMIRADNSPSNLLWVCVNRK